MGHQLVLWFRLLRHSFPPKPEGVTTKQVPNKPAVSISYKQTAICETKAKAYAGYITLPVSYLKEIETAEPYNVSMFYWYFEAREDPENAPTAIYLAGGPGESSILAMVTDGGPCYVNPDSNSTKENPWSMNQKVNMLFVDQPAGAGYSYNELVKSTLDLTNDGFPPKTWSSIKSFDEWEGNVPEQKHDSLVGHLTFTESSTLRQYYWCSSCRTLGFCTDLVQRLSLLENFRQTCINLW